MNRPLQATVNDEGLIRWSDAAFATLRGFAGQRVTVTIEKWRAKRSPAQRRFCHGVMLPIIQEFMGCTAEELRANLKGRFPQYFLTYRERIGKDGINREMKVVKSFEDLTIEQQEKFNTECRAWAMDFFRLDIPLPNEVPLEEL